MAVRPQKLCELTGLQYDKSANTFWGTLQGYPVFLTVVPRRDTVIFRLIAKTPSDEADAAVQSEANTWCTSHSGVTGLAYRDRALSAAVSLSPKDTEENLSAAAAAIVSFAAAHSMTACCMSCGTETGYRAYLLDSTGVTVCDSCKPYLEQKMQEAQEDAAAVRANPFGLAAGIVIGAAAVFLLTYFVLKLSYLSMLTGYAGLLLGLFLMRKLGKKLTIPAVAVCTILCMLAGVGATLLSFAGSIADYNTENFVKAQQICEAYRNLEALVESAEYEDSLPENLKDISEYKKMNDSAELIISHTDTKSCLKDLPMLLKEDNYAGIKPELIKCLLFSLLSVLAGALLTAPPMLRADQGKHTLRELPT